MDSTSISIWVPIAIACGISVWALLSILGNERQRRQLSHPREAAPPPAPPANATNIAKPVATKDDAQKPGRAAA